MKKWIGFVSLVLALLLFLGACGKEDGIRYNYDLAEYVEIGDVHNIKAPYADPNVCTDSEIDYAIHQIMLTYAEFTAKEEDSVIQLYDKAVVDYKIFQNGQEIEEFSHSEYGIVAGYDANGDLDTALIKELMGKKVGDTCKVEYTFPTDVSLGSWAGATVECQGTVLGIYRASVPECTDEFVQRIEKLQFTTVQEFRDQLKLDIMSQKQEAKKQLVLDAFISGVKVKKYPDAEVKDYVEDYITDLKTMADEMQMEYVDYLKEYMQATEDQINDIALEDARRRVKNDMACIQASRILQVTFSQEEYKKRLQGYYEQEADKFASAEEFEIHYTRPFMEDCIRWDIAFEGMVDSAVSTLEQ